MKKVKNIKGAVQKLKQMMQMKKDGMKGKLAAFMNLLVASGKKASVLACLVAMLACASVDKKHGMNEADSEKNIYGITEQDGKEIDKEIQKALRKQEAENSKKAEQDQERDELGELIQELLRKQEAENSKNAEQDQEQDELGELIQELLRKQEGGHCAATAKDDAEFEKFIQGIINGKVR